ncbi:MAG: galactokinase [Eubacteriales bacterium]
MIDLEKLQNSFKKIFKRNNFPRIYFSPGRINIIGEHIDYNGGYVLPAAVNLGTYAGGSRNNENIIRLFSLNYEKSGVIKSPIKNISYKEEQNWANYPLGVIKTFQNKGFELDQGIDIIFYGDIPHSSGLSSSASIELATAEALKDIFGFRIDKIETAKICRESENNFNRVNCGIMDQFACSMGEKNKIILLKSDTLKYTLVPFNSRNHRFIVTNSNVSRKLSDSKYNERVAECNKALKDLNKKIKAKNLCSITPEIFADNRNLIENETHKKRAEHAVMENHRSKLAGSALANGDLKIFGNLMYQSHKSLKDKYEVSISQLDTLVNLARKQGALGSKMTGAGFGGCTVSLVENKSIPNFIENIKKEYQKKFKIEPSIYPIKISKGTHRIK